MCYESNEIMFGTDLESWDVILFNNKKFGQHLWTFVDFCWLKNQMKYRKNAIFDNPKGISKRKYGLKKSTSVDQIFFVKNYDVSAF